LDASIGAAVQGEEACCVTCATTAICHGETQNKGQNNDGGRMTTRDDIEDMILRVALQDRAAFEALYSATSAKLFGIVLRVLHMPSWRSVSMFRSTQCEHGCAAA